MPRVSDRIKETSTTTGTGTLTLAGAVSEFEAFGDRFADGDVVDYAIYNGTEWEVGRGTLGGSGTTLTRDEVYQSTNSDAKVNLSAGTKYVYSTISGRAAMRSGLARAMMIGCHWPSVF